jgi:hypothetical protein
MEICMPASLRAAADLDKHAGYERKGVAIHQSPTGVELQCIRMVKRLEK